MPQQKLQVMISSTALDLPEHRKELVEACLRQDAFPLRMEDLPANSEAATAASLKIIDDADIYIGLFANRYGYVPRTNNPSGISITEMEYNRAVERKVQRLIFIMDKSHPITVDDVEIENAAKLKAFKDRVGAENIVKFFKSPADLRAEAINSLSKLRQPHPTVFHYVSDIPALSEPFIAHPYTLLQTPNLIGRHAELKLLTEWVTGKGLDADERKAKPNSVRIMNIVAIGGLGKSALTWKWFNDIAPQEMKPLSGRMWWSFYESDATFENFITRALAYVTKRPLNEVQQIPTPSRESQLLAVLNREPFLLVLDGLERILVAYARMDAVRLDDSQVGRERNLRKSTDPRVGIFLKRLAQVKNSRILVSTRLYPAELETDAGEPLPGSFRCDIRGLTDEDAIELWRAFGVSGTRDDLLPVFTSFGKHPLLIQALAGEVKRWRRAPGNLARWLKANPRFDPTVQGIQDAMAHVLGFALRGLDQKSHHALEVLAAFRMPARYETLAAVLVSSTAEVRKHKRGWRDVLDWLDALRNLGSPYNISEHELDTILVELEDRGLLGWDKRANRYDLHPIVRSVVWSRVGRYTRRVLYAILHVYFGTLPIIHDDDDVESLEDLTPAIELYNTLIGLERYDDAERLFYERLDGVMLYRLNSIRTRVELLEMLFPDGLDELPRLSRSGQSFTINALAQGYQFGGQPGRAAVLYHRANSIDSEMNANESLSVGLGNLSEALLLSGSIRGSALAVRRALLINRDLGDRADEAVNLLYLGMTLATQGGSSDSRLALSRSSRMLVLLRHSQFVSMLYSCLAQEAIWRNDMTAARCLADRAWELTNNRRDDREVAFSARVQGEAALGLREFGTANERLHHALARARMVSYVEEELPGLIALAELRRVQAGSKAALEFLDDVWDAAERGPYPLFHADAFNVLAQIERDEGNKAAAVEAATKAYHLAWCDGPPFAYHWGLEKAKKHLKELGAPEPEMPPLDESTFEPMPKVEIDPVDEFHVGEGSGGARRD